MNAAGAPRLCRRYATPSRQSVQHGSLPDLAAWDQTRRMEPAEYQLMDEAEDRMWWYRALHARLAAQLGPIRGLVLDAGCGTGGFLALLGRVRPDLVRVGVEWDAGAAVRAREKSGAPVARGSVNTLPFRDAAFQAVISADVLCHDAVDPVAALAEFRRVLVPGGRLVLNMPAYAWLSSAHDVRVRNARRVTRTELAGWLHQAGFVAPRLSHWNALLLPLMIVQRKLLARGPAASDVAPFPPWLDAWFFGVTDLERRLPVRLPFGGSVIAVARSPEPEFAA
jgi:SAM-dependent methyltransferase